MFTKSSASVLASRQGTGCVWEVRVRYIHRDVLIYPLEYPLKIRNKFMK